VVLGIDTKPWKPIPIEDAAVTRTQCICGASVEPYGLLSTILGLLDGYVHLAGSACRDIPDEPSLQSWKGQGRRLILTLGSLEMPTLPEAFNNDVHLKRVNWTIWLVH
jgi:hypothetical protein